MNEAMQTVFGVLRQADEHELESALIAKRARMSKQRTATAVSGLRRAGLVRVRCEAAGLRRRFVSFDRRRP